MDWKLLQVLWHWAENIATLSSTHLTTNIPWSVVCGLNRQVFKRLSSIFYPTVSSVELEDWFHSRHHHCCRILLCHDKFIRDPFLFSIFFRPPSSPHNFIETSGHRRPLFAISVMFIPTSVWEAHFSIQDFIQISKSSTLVTSESDTECYLNEWE